MPSNEPRVDERARLRVDVLGPLRVRTVDGRDITPEGALQRRLLALLVLRRGRVVSVDAAVDVLWPDKPPRDPVAALHNHVFRLRREFPDGAVEWLGNGYRLDPASVDVDVDRVTDTVSAAPGDPGLSTDLIDALIEQWDGPAYPELADVDDGRIESDRLAELRLRLEELRAERLLAVGDTDGLVADLGALVEREPLRERPRSLLMSALAATGRQAEALRVYDDFRRRLSEELGIEPSPSLASQHADLLANTGVAGWTPPHRLPVAATSLVGRDGVLSVITALAASHRLVTLVGPGGVGKTRLLVEVGHRLRSARPDRPIVMCELATATVESAPDVVATALAIEARPGVGLTERVAAVLADADAVLFLDNCEHVLDVIAELVERILATCPKVAVMATSRERLRLPGEQLVSVGPLAVAPDDAAVRLFVERARAVSPDFEPDSSEMELIVDIVRRLDGLPLAIELAAARLHALDVAEIAAALDQRFALLSEGFRTSARHGSLAAAMSWSFGLLDEQLQRVLGAVSVFAGRFGVADAATVCALDVETATAALHQLVERSLVMRAPGRRYVLLETVRAFAAEQLSASGRAGDVAERHAVQQVEWIERARLDLGQPDGPALTDIDERIAELRAAHTWLVEHGRAELAGRLTAALFDYGFLRLRPDVLAWSERITQIDPDDESPLAAAVWASAAYASWMAGDLDESLARGIRAFEVGDRSPAGVPSELAMIRGNAELLVGNLADAVEWYRRAAVLASDNRTLRLFAESTELLALAYAGDPRVAEHSARLLAEIGDDRTPHASYIWYCVGEADLASDVVRARERLTRALEIAEETNASFVTGVAGASRASIEARHGDPERAADDYRRLVTHWHRAGMWPTQWTMLRSIAGLLARLGRYVDAAVLLGAVQAPRRGNRIFGADETTLALLGERLRVELGDDAFEAALRDGAGLDASAVVEHALRAL